MAAEAEGIAQGGIDLALAGLVGHVIEIALRIGIIEIDRGREKIRLDRLDAGDEFHRTGRAEEVTRHRLGRADRDIFGVVTEDGLDRVAFHHVAHWSGGAVRVNVIDLVQGQARAFDRVLHGLHRANAARRGHVIGVGGKAVAGQFRENISSTFLCVLEFFDDNDACTFTHDKSIAVLVEGTGSALGIIVAGAEGAHGGKPAHAEGDAGGFTATGNHDVRFIIANQAPGFPDTIIGGRTGRDDGKIGTGKAKLDGDQAGGHVGDHHRDHERGDPPGSFVQKDLILIGEGLQSTNAGSDEDANTVSGDLGGIQPGMEHGLLGGSHGELRVAIRPAGVFLVTKILLRFKIQDLGRKAAIVLGGIPDGDRRDAALACHKVIPRGIDVEAEGSDRSHAGDDNAPFAHKGFNVTEDEANENEKGTLYDRMPCSVSRF